MTFYGYITMIIINSYIIWFYFDLIMQLKQSYYIATNIRPSSRKVLLFFGDLPDWWCNEMQVENM